MNPLRRFVQQSHPDQITAQPRNSDVGGHHLAFHVDDIGAAVTFLKWRGVRVLGDPTVRTAGPSGGQTRVCFLAPWGMQVELVSFPDGDPASVARCGLLPVSWTGS